MQGSVGVTNGRLVRSGIQAGQLLGLLTECTSKGCTSSLLGHQSMGHPHQSWLRPSRTSGTSLAPWRLALLHLECGYTSKTHVLHNCYEPCNTAPHASNGTHQLTSTWPRIDKILQGPLRGHLLHPRPSQQTTAVRHLLMK